MRRREFIRLIASAATAWSLAPRAQAASTPVIGFLHTASPDPYARLVIAYLQGLQEQGYVDHQNVLIEYRWAEGQFDRLPILAGELIDQNVSLIAALGGSASALAAKRATSTIPIVFSSGEVDPVKSGLVASLNRPGGNVTGVNPMTSTLAAKRLGLLRDLMPKVMLVGYLKNSKNPNSDAVSKEVYEAAAILDLKVHTTDVSSDEDFEPAFQDLRQNAVGAAYIGTDPFYFSRRQKIVDLAARYALPAIYATREFVVAGGLISYAASFVDAYRLAGNYSGRILKGEKASDLPVVQSVKFDLAINAKTAQTLHITLPAILLATADEVIE
jgi:putative tryptophan/tyrosine transport system substrate-binding protein